MTRVRNIYLLFVVMLAASAVTRVFQPLPLPALQGLTVVVTVALGMIVLGIRRGLVAAQAIELRRHHEAQMSILILLVVAGIGAAFQILVRFGGYGANLHGAILILNWALYGWALGWIVAGLWRSQRALLTAKASPPADAGDEG